MTTPVNDCCKTEVVPPCTNNSTKVRLNKPKTTQVQHVTLKNISVDSNQNDKFSHEVKLNNISVNSNQND